MTMLDRMRRHRDWLKWSLGLVCLAFVLFYIPDFLRGTGADAASADTIAMVEGHEITAGEFRRTYQAQMQAYRSALRREHERAAAEAARHRAADPPADGRRARGAGRSRARSASPSATRKCASASSRCRRSRRTARFIGEQRYQQLLRIAAAAADAVRVRRQRPPRLDGREAAGVAHRLAVGARQGTRAGVPPPERQDQARRRHASPPTGSGRR